MLVASFIYIKITRDAPENIGRTERISGEEAKIVECYFIVRYKITGWRNIINRIDQEHERPLCGQPRVL